MGMSVLNTALGVAGVGGQIYAADQQADAITDAARSSNELQRYIYDTNRADQQPWRDAGLGALGQLSSLYGLGGQAPDFSGFYNSPGYQFGLDQGVQALDRSAASRGRLRSGAQDMAITRYGQDYGSTKFGEYANRLAGLAGVGQSATNQLGQYGMNYANQAGQNSLYAGNAQASAYGNMANAFSGFTNDLAYGLGRTGPGSP